MKIKYKIKTKNEEPTLSIIEKSGFTIEFTLNDIEVDIRRMQKSKEEIVAKARIERAVMQNVLSTNPEVKKMDEKKRIAAYLYQKSLSFCREAEKKLKEIDKQMDEYRKETKEIFQQTGIVLLKK